MKRVLSVLLTAILVCSMTPKAFAASDIDNHWSKQYIEYMHAQGVINPDSSGKYYPDKEISRVEFIWYLNRAFHFTEKADISFKDVAKTAWYYEPVKIAVKHGYINGVGENKMDPAGTLTREQAATIISRLHKYEPANDGSQLNFSDKSKISSWSIGYIGEAAKKGYISGYPDNTFRPQGKVTIAEVAKMLCQFMGTGLSEKDHQYLGSYLRSNVENVTISEPCTLSDAVIPGDLYITEGVLNGQVTLNHVTVSGRIILCGGTVQFNSVTAPTVLLSSPTNRLLKLTVSGDSNLAKTQVASNASLVEKDLTITAGGFSDLILKGTAATTMNLDANVWDISLESASTLAISSSSVVNTLSFREAATSNGSGIVQKAIFYKTGATMTTEPKFYELASGVTATINGKKVASSNSVTLTPDSLTFDISQTSTMGNAVDIAFSVDPGALNQVTCEGVVLRNGEDYRATETGMRLYKTYLSTLKTGTYTLSLMFADGGKGSFAITLTDTSRSTLSPSQATFDKYKSSSGYQNITLKLNTMQSMQLNSLNLGGNKLELGVDYTYNSTTGEIVLQRTYLEKRSIGSYTMTFDMLTGNDPTLSLIIQDSTPINRLSKTSLDFDANISAGNSQDLSVTLSTSEGATLKYIKADGKQLDENWQYKVEGSTVTLNKNTVASLTNNSNYCDFTFVMSTGINPVLRVNYVTTSAVKVSLTDDLGTPIPSATVTISPANPADATASASQTATTAVDGYATFYVKRGSYVVTAEGGNFSKLTTNVNVSGNQTVKMVGAVLETLRIYVTDSYGAKISNASVSVGAETVKTGSDGLASFSLKRGNYTVTVSSNGYLTSSKAVLLTTSMVERVILNK